MFSTVILQDMEGRTGGGGRSQGLQLYPFCQGPAGECFFLIGIFKLQLRLFQFRKGKKTHSIGRVNRPAQCMGKCQIVNFTQIRNGGSIRYLNLVLIFPS